MNIFFRKVATRTERMKSPTSQGADDVDLNDPSLTIPFVRYNAMLAVLRNTLYMYLSLPFFSIGSDNVPDTVVFLSVAAVNTP